MESLNNLADNVCLYFNTSIIDALNLSTRVAEERFKGKAFEQWKNSREYDARTQNAIIERLNGVIQACGIVAKTVANTVPRR